MRYPPASHSAAELLVRNGDVNGDGRVLLDQYLRMMAARGSAPATAGGCCGRGWSRILLLRGEAA